MPEIVRRFRSMPWPQTGAEPLSGFGWGVFEEPGPIAEGDFTSLANDLVELCMIKRLSPSVHRRMSRPELLQVTTPLR